MRYEFVEVIWLDAVSSNGWVDPKEPMPPTKIITRGWLITENDDYVTLTMSIDADNPGEVGNTWTIPQGMILEIRTFEVEG